MLSYVLDVSTNNILEDAGVSRKVHLSQRAKRHENLGLAIPVGLGNYATGPVVTITANPILTSRACS